MKIVLFTHPTFLAHQSMPRFAQMIVEGMRQKGHEIVIWSPKAFFFKLAFKKTFFEKWLSYIDQYLVFPITVKLRLLRCDKNTLFVFSDNALGPWIPLVKNRYHVVHCHDFLAQKSAFGLLPESRVGFSGKQYQKYIQRGYRKAQNFISISKKTQSDLHYFLSKKAKISRVVYNGLNQNFESTENNAAIREKLSDKYSIDLSKGYILHVGGNAFYKNKLGALQIYEQWRKISEIVIPLVLVGEAPSVDMISFQQESTFSNSIYFLTDIGDVELQQFYQGSTVMLFPSLYEGFGWPIIEAMASGTLVITTDQDPMKEVAGNAGFYIQKKPTNLSQLLNWKIIAAQKLETVIEFTADERSSFVERSILHSKKFSSEDFVHSIESIYLEILRIK